MKSCTFALWVYNNLNVRSFIATPWRNWIVEFIRVGDIEGSIYMHLFVHRECGNGMRNEVYTRI